MAIIIYVKCNIMASVIMASVFMASVTEPLWMVIRLEVDLE